MVELQQDAWNSIAAHAQETFPDECCGVVFSRKSADRVVPLKNIQNKLHALDPLTYPRTAVIAYAMDPLELDNVIRQAEANGERLKAFYHSHPNHEAYFSDEDKLFACPFGEPTFPDTVQIVVSIYLRSVKTAKAFLWSDEKSDFVEVPLHHI
jgi:[CysO sulfur-carrier protein]-S-L-cysteine hydrolase